MDKENIHGYDVEGNPINEDLKNYSSKILGTALILYNILIFLVKLIPAICATYLIGIIWPHIYIVDIFNLFGLNNFWIIVMLIFVIQLFWSIKGTFLFNRKK